jgi:hypothetical protein
MSALTIAQSLKLAEALYLYSVKELYGQQVCSEELLDLYMKQQAIRVLEWNETALYLSDADIQKLETFIQSASAGCGCNH